MILGHNRLQVTGHVRGVDPRSLQVHTWQSNFLHRSNDEQINWK